MINIEYVVNLGMDVCAKISMNKDSIEKSNNYLNMSDESEKEIFYIFEAGYANKYLKTLEAKNDDSLHMSFKVYFDSVGRENREYNSYVSTKHVDSNFTMNSKYLFF